MSVETKNFYPKLTRTTTPTSSGSDVVSYSSDLGPDTPVLTLIHGYPQSAFIWRHIVPLLIDRISLFVPEIPGYGVSSPAKEHSKRVVGGALLEALSTIFASSSASSSSPPSSTSPRKVVVAGHDRGARICHRLAVSRTDYPSVTIVGAVLLDILPTKVQWDKFANPAIGTGYFHWPFLANVELAVKMIESHGGDGWCRELHRRIVGPNETGQARVYADDAVDVYAALFKKTETIRGSCEDYHYGASIECKEQSDDQQAGRKLDVPTLVMFSKLKLGSTADVAEEWKDWVAPGVAYEGVAVGDDYGHYLPEEACDVVTEHILAYLKKNI